jgi:thiamine-phosphate pyrophosphorylase
LLLFKGLDKQELMPKEPYLCRLYLVSPPKIDGSFAATLKDTLAAGDVAAFQLRLKDASDDEIKAAVKTLLPIVHETGAAFILNDRVDLVEELGVDGVHLGQDDMPLKEARKQLPDSVIGVSCHDSAHLAMEAGEGGADYVAFGAFHATQSKSPEKLAKYGTPTKEILQNWAEITTVPSVAIGGMTPENCGPFVTAGADFIAAITAVWSHPKGAAAAVKEFNDAIKAGLKARA